MSIQHALQLLSLNLKVRSKSWEKDNFIIIKDNFIVDNENNKKDWNELVKCYSNDEWEVFHDE